MGERRNGVPRGSGGRYRKKNRRKSVGVKRLTDGGPRGRRKEGHMSREKRGPEEGWRGAQTGFLEAGGGRDREGRGRQEGSTDARRDRWREGQKDRATGAGARSRCPQPPGTELEPGGGPSPGQLAVAPGRARN